MKQNKLIQGVMIYSVGKNTLTSSPRQRLFALNGPGSLKNCIQVLDVLELWAVQTLLKSPFTEWIHDVMMKIIIDNRTDTKNWYQYVFCNNKLKWSSRQGLDEGGIVGSKCKKNWILFSLTESLSITFLALISLAEKLTDWRLIGAHNFYLCPLIDDKN